MIVVWSLQVFVGVYYGRVGWSLLVFLEFVGEDLVGVCRAVNFSCLVDQLHFFYL